MESIFQFKNPILTKLDFGLNSGFDKKQKTAQMKTNIAVNINKSKEKNEAIVALNIKIGSKDDTVPFYIEATEESIFKWEEGLELKDVDSLLNVNAPALLLSYIRPLIAQTTSASPYSAYNIPFMNFTDTNKEVNDN